MRGLRTDRTAKVIITGLAFVPAPRQQFNRAHNSVRAIGERGNAILKVMFKALRNVSVDPWRIGCIVAAALAILHFDHARTT